MLFFIWSTRCSKAHNNVHHQTDCGEVAHIPKDEHHAESHSAVTPISDTLRGMKSVVQRVGLAVILSVGVAACSSGNSGAESSDTTVIEIALVPASKVIDVRTASEFSEGHVKGARNLDIRNGDFDKALADLDKDAAYSVYCRSGNRSADAVERMRNAGFKNVVDLGALEEAAQSLSLPIVTN